MTMAQMTDSHLLYAMMKLQRNCMERYADTVSRNYQSVQASRFHLTKICQLAGEYANRNLLPAEVDTEEQLWNWLLVKNDEYLTAKNNKAGRLFSNHQQPHHVNHKNVAVQFIVPDPEPLATPTPALPTPVTVTVEVERKLRFTPL
jgi:hypothetical protein